MATFVLLKTLQISVLSVSQDSFAPYVTFKSFSSLCWKQSLVPVSSVALIVRNCNFTNLFVIIELMMTSH